MINLFRKGFIYLTLMLLVLCSFSIESASAAEVVDYEEGVTNLNNTPENSAVVGSKLLKPEIGWKRYDDLNPKILLENPYYFQGDRTFYKGSTTFLKTNKKITFFFTGTKFRIISAMYSNRSNKIEVNIDGKVVDNFSQDISNLNENTTQKLAYEKNNISPGIHVVVLTNLGGNDFEFDAVEVDGKLFAKNEIPNTDSIILDKNILELFEGNSEKLKATVLPEDATNKKVVWTSSDTSIATVDQNGNVTAIREGEAIITAKIENTELIATATVIVKKPISESSSAILSITLVNGITKEYDVTNTVLNNYLNWFETGQGTSTFKFSKTISPYKNVTEYIVHDKIASFEVREY